MGKTKTSKKGRAIINNRTDESCRIDKVVLEFSKKQKKVTGTNQKTFIQNATVKALNELSDDVKSKIGFDEEAVKHLYEV